MKKCSICKQLLPLTDFYKNNTANDGAHAYCIRCFLEKYRARKEHTLEWQRSKIQKAVVLPVLFDDDAKKNPYLYRSPRQESDSGDEDVY